MEQGTQQAADQRITVKQGVLITAGSVCVVLAILGILLPVLPTTPFLLLAAICYERSSPRFHNWLLTNRWFGSYIKNYREGKGIPMRQKVVTLALLWATMLAGIVFGQLNWWLSLILLGIAAGVTIHLARIKTARPDDVVIEETTVT